MLKSKLDSMNNFKGLNRKNIGLINFKNKKILEKILNRMFQINYTSDLNLKLYLIQNILPPKL
jgi:hypothetical protein